jgi:prophage regulatory protein
MHMPAPRGTQRAALPDDGFIRRRRLLELIPISSTELDRRIANGTFAAPTRLSARVVVWPVEVIRSFIDAHKAPQG